MAESSKPMHRKIKPPEERAKRGRWIIIVLLIATLFLSYAFSLSNR
jgi:hypothetical protein